MKTDFWAQLSWPNQPGEVWTTLNSPAFSAERELIGWIREHRGEYAEVRAMRREITDGGFKDIPLTAHDEEYPPDLERLGAVLAPLRVLIDAKRPTRKMTAPSEWSLRRAVAALTPAEVKETP